MRSVIKYSVIIYASIGLLVGIIISIASLMGQDIPFHMGTKQISGITSGVIAIFFVPVIMGIVGLVHGIILWFPIVFIVKKIRV